MTNVTQAAVDAANKLFGSDEMRAKAATIIQAAIDQAVADAVEPQVARAMLAEEMLNAIDAAAPKWLPIETAPKDGSWVLCFVMGAEIPAVAYFHEVLSRWMTLHPDDAVDDEWERELEMRYDPTHWMPLPAAPVADATGK